MIEALAPAIAFFCAALECPEGGPNGDATVVRTSGRGGSCQTQIETLSGLRKNVADNNPNDEKYGTHNRVRYQAVPVSVKPRGRIFASSRNNSCSALRQTSYDNSVHSEEAGSINCEDYLPR
jgi:hypothetical protein